MTASIRDLLAETELLRGLDDEALGELVPELEHVRLQGGQLLLRQGEVGDCLYIVAYGRLRVVAERPDGSEQLVGEVARGDTVGEVALLTGEPRNVTVRAARDSELYRLAANAFDRLLARHPGLAVGLARHIVRRYVVTGPAQPRTAPSTIALVPTSWETPLSTFSHRLEHALSAAGPVLRLNSDVVDRALGRDASQVPPDHSRSGEVLAWLNEQEAQHRFVLYEADLVPSAWSRRCVRHADHVLVVASADHDAETSPLETRLYGEGSDAPSVRKELVLLHRQSQPVYASTSRWLAKRPVAAHHHVALESRTDVERLARFLTGRATAVVLGGGGARSFAHIGVLRAVREAGVEIDIIGGASMGAYMAAQYALGWTPEQMRVYNGEAWRLVKPMTDYTVPVLSVLTGRGFREIAQGFCGDTAIEDLGQRFFCVSSNLTRGKLEVHQQQGSLWRSILASISVPGLLPPVTSDGALLVDGAILDNVPVDVAEQIGGGTIIASDVSPVEDLATSPDVVLPRSGWGALLARRRDRPGETKLPTIADVLLRVSTMSSLIAAEAATQAASLYLRPPVASFTVVDWTRVDEMVEAGYKHAAWELAEWLARDKRPPRAGTSERRRTTIFRPANMTFH